MPRGLGNKSSFSNFVFEGLRLKETKWVTNNYIALKYMTVTSYTLKSPLMTIVNEAYLVVIT